MADIKPDLLLYCASTSAQQLYMATLIYMITVAILYLCIGVSAKTLVGGGILATAVSYFFYVEDN